WGPVGRGLLAVKSAVGTSMNRLRLERTTVGDRGVDLRRAMLDISRLSIELLPRFDYRRIFERRRASYARLRGLLEGRVRLIDKPLTPGTCPLFFPLLVKDKGDAAAALRAHGVAAIEFWNGGDPEAGASSAPEAHFLRRHLLELPIHQDL